MKISIVGATGLVGRNIIELCEEYFDNSVEYHLYASKESEGKTLQVNGKEVPIRELSSKNIESCDIALFSAGGERSREFANQFVDKGAFVIDNSSSFRMEKTVPLVVYGINEDIIKNDSKIIANPNCTTMALVMALKPLHDIFNLLSIVPVSYQAVSGSGKSAIESLENELANLSTPGSAPDEKYYQSQIAKNVIPIAGNITENGYSDEEMKFSNESKKILNIPDLNVEPSNARVGVETGHGIFCTATFEKDVDVESAIESLEAFEGVEYWKKTYPTPLDAQGNKNILVSRMRSGLTSNKILNFWAVGDNLLKGAALNAVQIANHLYKNDFYTK